ncbi:hypothetical protein [Nocardiopsis sp. NPDC058789]|uniref:hypothetical protein n=1 Tax=Nocardiopsis sp. NPDC058789 TaxID=3346634 RepID=UPI003672F236
MTSINTSVRLAAASAVSVLALTACSSSAQVYDYGAASYEPSESIEFRLPEEVVEQDEDYARSPVLESVLITSVEAEDPSLCAVEYQFEYVDGGYERLVEAAELADREDEPHNFAYFALTGKKAGDSDMAEDQTSSVVQTNCAVSPSDDESTVDVIFPHIREAGDTAEFFAEFDVAVMQSGELYVHETKVGDWQMDSNGNWVK